MVAMSNLAYLSIWFQSFREEQILERFGKFLSTVPFSASRPGFTYLTIRAVDASESPVLEQDLRSVPMDTAGIIGLANDYLHADCSYEVSSHWDLWVSNGEAVGWKQEPQPLEILCHGEDYDDSFWQDNGHLQANLGFEHLFTGHARLLGFRRGERRVAESPEEARFLEAMAWPENLQRYQEKTRENIRKLLDWTRQVEQALPAERVRLWSEGEENFEARMEEILAVR